MTLDQGSYHYWGWGRNDEGQVGNGTNGNNISQYVPVPVQFCTRCQRAVQLGTNGSFTAQCSGTLVLYFNDEQGHFDDNSGSYTVSFDGLPTNVFVVANDPTGYSAGVAIGAVTNGGVYTCSASGTCSWNNDCSTCQADPNGNGTNVDCSSINITNAICPALKCFSLVGKIQ